RQASTSEQELLAKYVGWGGLANDFFDDYNPKFSKEREELKSIVTDKEYSDMKQSSLTAYYTDPALIRQMWDKLERDGFTGGKILDPSMGTGNFFAAMPKHLREKSELYGVELDTITGAIAKHLHPNSHIEIKGFETVAFNDNSFDLVISNVPFANIRIADNRYD
ncbi:N-6 DNA methylase, partial [Streptococcus suis]